MSNLDKSGKERGTIKYLNRYKQSKLISYEGMVRRRNITPTDIDGFIDYNGRVFIWLEGKLIDKNLDFGQELALMHLVQMAKDAGRFACVIVFYFLDPEDSIIVAKDKYVYKTYDSISLEWKEPKNPVTLLRYIEQIESYCENKLGIQL
jgi:hypothetical protein